MEKRRILELNIDFNNNTKNFEMNLNTFDFINKEKSKETIRIDYSIVMKIIKVLEGLEI